MLVTTTVANAVDLSQMAGAKIAIDATEPPGTAIKYAVKKDGGNWQKWNGGSWVDLSTQQITQTSLLAEGNTTTELSNADFSPMLGGKQINVCTVWAIMSGKTQPTLNSIKFSGKPVSSQKVIHSDAIVMTHNNKPVGIIDIGVSKQESNGGTVSVLASIQGANDDWSEYKDYTAYITTPKTKAKAIKFKAILSAPPVGSATVTLSSIVIQHRFDDVGAFAEGNGECISKTLTFDRTMSRAMLVINHDKLPKDTALNAYISLRAAPHAVTNEILGIGDGSRHTYTLRNTKNIEESTITLKYDGVEQNEYTFSATNGTITCIAPQGQAITIDYTYGYLPEEFIPMQYTGDRYRGQELSSQFEYRKTRPTDPAGAMSGIKIELVQMKGTIKSELVGIGGGTQQAFELSHWAKEKSLTVMIDNIPTKQYVYKPLTNVLLITAGVGAKITCSYDWVAKQPSIDSFYAIWNE